MFIELGVSGFGPIKNGFKVLTVIIVVSVYNVVKNVQ